MEQFLLSRLELRKKRLEEHIKTARDLLEEYRKGTAVLHKDLLKCELTLKQSIQCIQADMSQYMATGNIDADLLNTIMENQVMGEDLMVEFELLMNLCSNNPETKEAVPKTSARLPKLDLLKFDGDILKWTEFWDMFTANVHSQNLKPVEKLAYLLRSLENKAKDGLEGLSITNDNYDIAVEMLKSRYGHKNKVIDSHYVALSGLRRSDDTASNCRRNLNEINKHLRVLTSLGENENSNHLRSLIMEKFPDKVLYELNLLTANDQSVSLIRATLDTIVGAMERAQVHTEPIATPSASTEAFHIGTRKPIFHKGKRVFRQSNHKVQKPVDLVSRKRPAASNYNMASKKAKRACIFCNGDHYNDECTVVQGIEDRRKKLVGRCFKCLKEGHRASKCTRSNKCYHCKGDHNRALCPKGKSQGKSYVNAVTTSLLGKCPIVKSFLQTATAQVVHNNKTLNCRLLLDSGSSRSYITSGLAKNLDLTFDSSDLLLIFTFGAEKAKETISPCSDVAVKTKRGVEKSIHVNVVPHITSRIPIPKIPKTSLADILADGGVNEEIDMLIGTDYYYSFMRNDTIQIDKDLFLVDTDFGWIVSGHLNEENEREENVLTVATYHQSSKECTCYMQPDLPLRQSDIKFLWSLENIGITDSVKATREEDAVQHFNNTVVYRGGRYYVKWPWTSYPPQLPTNYGLAYGRLKGLLQRLDQSTLQEYNDIIMDQLQAKIIEVIQVDEEVRSQSDPPIHYIGHHIVRQNGKRGRIVYDASARVQDQLSLNECLYRGPCMLQDLTALLLNFRLHRVGIIADVEKAYLQVGLQEEDREVTRFLWVKDITKPISNGNLVHLRFCRVPFGIISSAFLLTATIRYHVSKKNSDLLKDVANKCYVDNLVTGTNSTTEAIELFRETRKAFEELSMNLRDWESNEESFTKMVPESCKAKEASETKVLGLMWNKKEDVLTLNMSEELLSEDSPRKITKREVLRTLASVYDPCGIVTPVLMPIKLFLHELWCKDYKWDAPISSDLLLKWRDIKGQLHKIKGVKIPRCAVVANTNGRTENELHCFTDAGKDSYAAIAYLRSSNDSKVNISFLMAKGRIVPLDREKQSANKDVKKVKRKLTIPQLELLGCVIGNRLLTYLKDTLELPITRRYLWTDSLVVLSWIKSNKLLPPFIANRVEEIKKNTDVETCYVNTKHNPADIATRPELWTQKRDMWLKGPNFLSKNKDQWPKDMDLKSHQHQASFSVVAEGLDGQYPDYIPLKMASDEGQEQFSDLDLEGDDEPESDQHPVCSKVKEIKDLQREYYPEETKGKQTSLSRNLGLFKDIDGLLRCKGRMMNANWSFDMKYPILLPRSCTFTKNLIKETHEKNYHVGASHTLSLIRQQYWIPKGRPIVERMLRKCPQCVKHGGGPYALPPPPALPTERVNYSSPFTYTGLDYFGPVYVNTENGQQKRWVCLLTCLAVRAIHMEVVKNLTAEECIMALRRFMSTRGVPYVIVSDNAQYFKLSSEVLSNKHCVDSGIKWKFIPQLAPWHGAFYERMVGLVKNCMKRTLEKRLLNDIQLLTVIKEIEAVVNSRPLTRVGPDMTIVLRPCDFLSLGNCLNLEISEHYSEPTDTQVKRSLIEGWKRGQNMLNQFKNMFINQYLMNLRERYQHALRQPRVKSHKEPRVGDMVQIKGETKNRINWKVGKITNLVPSSDGQYRVAQVRVGDSIFTRSVGHLYPLELEEPLSPQAEIVQEQEARLEVPDKEQDEPQTLRVLEPMEENEQVRNLIEDMDTSETVPVRVREEEVNVEEREREVPKIPEPILEESGESLPLTEEDVSEDVVMQDEGPSRNEGVRRTAAIRAREKIAEWTRQLFVTI